MVNMFRNCHSRKHFQLLSLQKWFVVDTVAYQPLPVFLNPRRCHGRIFRIRFDDPPITSETFCNDSDGAGPAKGVQHHGRDGIGGVALASRLPSVRAQSYRTRPRLHFRQHLTRRVGLSSVKRGTVLSHPGRAAGGANPLFRCSGANHGVYQTRREHGKMGAMERLCRNIPNIALIAHTIGKNRVLTIRPVRSCGLSGNALFPFTADSAKRPRLRGLQADRRLLYGNMVVKIPLRFREQKNHLVGARRAVFYGLRHGIRLDPDDIRSQKPAVCL